MPDNLTDRLKRELARRGHIASDRDIQTFIQNQGLFDIGSNVAKQFRSGGPAPRTVPQEQKSSFWNAVGVGLWSLADTAAFGVPGAFIEEEKFLDFSETAAKYTGAIGSMAGFVAGAPMKVGAKAVQMVAKPFIKRVGKEAVETVASSMMKKGIKEGVSKSSMKQVVRGYKNLVRKAQTDFDVAENFGRKATDYIVKYADSGVAAGRITANEGAALKKALGDSVFKRPLQDFMGIMSSRGMAKTNPRLMRFAGHAINDMLMFGLIDTVFEGVSTIEDHEFDWTAPLWGVANGFAFSQLAWLKPKGKGAKWYPDFKAGIRASFGKDIYKKWSEPQLDATLKFFGESLKQSGRSHNPIIRQKTISLIADPMESLKSHFGDDALNVAREYLNSQRRSFGREMMKWATKESAQGIADNWMRMAAGGILFNAHSFAEMFISDYEPTIHDILPHFLIGAFLQIGRNPSRFDIDSNRMSSIRRNLYSLGFNTRQLDAIPSLRTLGNRFDQSLDVKTHPKTVGFMMERYVSDKEGVIRRRLEDGEVSVALEFDSKFEAVYDQMKAHGKFRSEYEAISVKDKNRFMKLFDEETHGKLKTVEDIERYFEDRAVEQSKGFEQEFPDIIEAIKNADEQRTGELGIEDVRDNQGGKDKYRVPSNLEPSESIYELARKGKIESLKNEDGSIASGDTAVSLLAEAFDGYSNIVVASEIMDRAVYKPGGHKRHTINTVELVEDIYNIVKSSEKRVNDSFPLKSSYASPFSFSQSANDYLPIVIKNASRDISSHIRHVFSKDLEDKSKNQLIDRMIDAGLMTEDSITKLEGVRRPGLINDVSKIHINVESGLDGTDPVQIERVGALKRSLERILYYQSLSNDYERVDLGKDGITVEVGKVESLMNFLKDMKVSPNISPYLHADTIRYMHMENIKGSKLTVDEISSVFELNGTGFTEVNFNAKKKAQGSSVYLIDEVTTPHSKREHATEYNNYMRDIVGRSNGLIAIAGKKSPIETSTIDMLYQRTVGSQRSDSPSATQIVMEFLQALPKGKDINFKNRMATYVDHGGSAKVVDWLIQSGFLEYDSKTKSGYNKVMQNFTAEAKKKMLAKMDNYGFTPQYLDRVYADESRRANEILDSSGYHSSFEKPYSFNDFLETYGIDNFNHARESAEVKKSIFESLIFSPNADIKDHIVDPNVVENALKRISVDLNNDGNLTRFTDLVGKQKSYYEKRIGRDILKLIGSQVGQRKINVIKVENEAVVPSESFQQRSPFSDKFYEWDIPYAVINPTASIYGEYGRKYINMFSKTDKTNERDSAELDRINDSLRYQLNNIPEIFGMTVSEPGADMVGMHVVKISKNIDPIAIPRMYFSKLVDPFVKFADKVVTDERINDKVRERIKEVRDEIQANPESIQDPTASWVLRHLIFEDMLTGKKIRNQLIDWLNNENIEKLSSRIKQYNSKNFTRYDKDILFSIGKIYKDTFKDYRTADVIKKYHDKDNVGVVIWNDGRHQTIKQQVDRYLAENKEIAEKWNYEDNIGTAHADVSGYDSIAYVSRDMLRYLHAISGNNPDSFNPIKPVISSGGSDGKFPLVIGKTLFVYSKDINTFFENNPGVDVLLTESATKAYNKGKIVNGLDTRVLNKKWDRLNEQRSVGAGRIRKISLRSVGIMPEKDALIKPATESVSDYNFLKPVENDLMWGEAYQKTVSKAVENMSSIMKSPMRVRQFIMSTLGESGLSVASETGGAAQLNALVAYSSHRDADPMSFSERNVKNKIYNYFINSILNGRKSVVDAEGKYRSGGQGKIIQVPSAFHQLRPTLVDQDGVMHSRGEILLPYHERTVPIKQMIENGREMRFVEDAKVMTGKEVFGEYWEYMKENNTLEDVFNTIQDGKKTAPGMEAEFGKNLQIGILTTRKPRKTPNDLALLGLKGFLDKEYGRSVIVNSFDVVNLFEGDYDADRVDYFYGHYKTMFNHAVEASKIFVQGQDPSIFQEDISFNWADPVSVTNKKFEKMYADEVLSKQMIGQVQKIPRALQYLESLSIKDYKDPKGPNVLFYTQDGGRVVMDYSNLDFFSRHSLEAQYIIDLSGQKNPEIIQDVSSWKWEFLFPEKSKSITPSKARNKGVGFINKMIRTKEVPERVRIFRYLNKDGEEIRELSSLEKDIIKTMMGEYGKFLNVAGEKTWQRTGEQNRTSYDDVYNASRNFFKFNKNLGRSLYYKLRFRQNRQGEQYYKTPEFNSYFFTDPSNKSYKTYYKDGKEKHAYYPDKDIFDGLGEKIRNNATDISDGNRGNILDRVLQRVYDADVFEDGGSKATASSVAKAGPMLGDMADWHHQLMTGSLVDDTNTVEYRQQKIMKNVLDYNSAAYFIGKLNRSMYDTSNRKDINYKVKQSIIAKIKETRQGVYNKIKELVPKDFQKTFKTADLTKFKFTPIESKRVKRAAIEMHTMHTIKDILSESSYGDPQWNLSRSAQDYLKEIKKVRKLFYSNNDNLGDILKYNQKTFLGNDQLEFLRNMPTLSTAYEIETAMLERGYNLYGEQFIYAFMEPIRDRYNIGIMDGQLIPLPYENTSVHRSGSARYNRGLKFLQQKAIKDEAFATERNAVNDMLNYIKTIEAQFERYVNRRTDMRNMLDDPEFMLDVGDGLQMSLGHIKMAPFDPALSRIVGDYSMIQWQRDSNRSFYGLNLMNDYALNYYKSLMEISGRQEEFAKYEKLMTGLKADMIKNNAINPIRYLAMRAMMDGDMKRLANDVFTSGVASNNDPVASNRLLSNPVWILNGGHASKGFKQGISLETKPSINKKRLREIVKLRNDIENLDSKYRLKSEDAESKVNEFIRRCE